MCRRPSRSLNMTVTALMRLSSVKYLSRSSWILWAGTRFLRCSFASRLSSSNSSYERVRKFLSSVDMELLGCEMKPAELFSRLANDSLGYRAAFSSGQLKVLMGGIRCIYGVGG